MDRCEPLRKWLDEEWCLEYFRMVEETRKSLPPDNMFGIEALEKLESFRSFCGLISELSARITLLRGYCKTENQIKEFCKTTGRLNSNQNYHRDGAIFEILSIGRLVEVCIDNNVAFELYPEVGDRHSTVDARFKVSGRWCCVEATAFSFSKNDISGLGPACKPTGPLARRVLRAFEKKLKCGRQLGLIGDCDAGVLFLALSGRIGSPDEAMVELVVDELDNLLGQSRLSGVLLFEYFQDSSGVRLLRTPSSRSLLSADEIQLLGEMVNPPDDSRERLSSSGVTPGITNEEDEELAKASRLIPDDNSPSERQMIVGRRVLQKHRLSLQAWLGDDQPH